jgi:hypothetical protein
VGSGKEIGTDFPAYALSQEYSGKASFRVKAWLGSGFAFISSMKNAAFLSARIS